jgi:anti-sigma factor RsiW
MDMTHAPKLGLPNLGHRQALEILPWYVNGQLDGQDSQRVKIHLAACPACRREAEGLAKLFSVHEQTLPDRPVDEGRLDAVFARIERYETERRKRSGRAAEARRSSWQLVSAWITDNLTPRTPLAAGTAVAVFAAVLAISMLRAPAPEVQHRVLSSTNPAAELRVRISFQAVPEEKGIERMIESSVGEQKVAGAYRIEQRADREYVVIFDRKPTIEAVSQLIEDWRGAPNVADVAIDGDPASASR